MYCGYLTAGVLLTSFGPSLAGPFPWREGLIETRVYVITKDGVKDGEIEQRLMGIVQDDQRRYRVTTDLVRRWIGFGDQDVIGRTTVEIVCAPETFDFVRREDSYHIFDTDGRARSSRIPGGVRVHGESAADSIPVEDVDKDISYEGPGPLVDQLTVLYVVRSATMQDGHTFQIDSVVPLSMQTDRLKGRVGPVQTLEWNGTTVQVRRVDLSSPSGSSAYYVQQDDERSLVRYISPDGEVYDLKPPAGG